MDEIPFWFRNAVGNGLQRLITLRLPRTPALEGDIMLALSKAWVEALWNAPVGWDESLDADRLERGFVRLSAHALEWPAPRQLLDCLPRRKQPMSLPSPPKDPRVVSQGRRKARTVVDDLMKKLRA